jgi:hypothetical protein
VKSLLVGALVALALAIPAVAVADSCSNADRAAPACDLSCTSPVYVGNWVWLPSLNPSLPAKWRFAPPGTIDSTTAGLPDQNGNYTNGQTSSLLGTSALCDPTSTATSARQTVNGIQSGCE